MGIAWILWKGNISGATRSGTHSARVSVCSSFSVCVYMHINIQTLIGERRRCWIMHAFPTQISFINISVVKTPGNIESTLCIRRYVENDNYLYMPIDCNKLLSKTQTTARLRFMSILFMLKLEGCETQKVSFKYLNAPRRFFLLYVFGALYEAVVRRDHIKNKKHKTIFAIEFWPIIFFP